MAIVRIRGLPFSARADDILEFFKNVKIKGGKRGIFFPQGPNGRSNGEAYIELESDGEMEKALAQHNEHIGNRYIEVFRSHEDEMDNAMGRHVDPYRKREHVVRLRGLPYDTEKKEIFAFFNGLEIAPNGIGLLVDHMGRCTGEAYVQFTSLESLARAKEKHMEKIGHRYIEIFESTMMEANMTIQKQMTINRDRASGQNSRYGRESNFYGSPRGSHSSLAIGPNGTGYGRVPPGGRFTPYGRPPHPAAYAEYYSPPKSFGGPSHSAKSSGHGFSYSEEEEPQSITGHSVRMRGLPFVATTKDIDRFLAPLQPVHIRIRFSSTGRPTGEALVDFASHDEAKEAMKKDREKIGSRYIELFLVSTPMGNPHSSHISSDVESYSSLRHSSSPYTGHRRSSNGGDVRRYYRSDYDELVHPDEFGVSSKPFTRSDFEIGHHHEMGYNGVFRNRALGPSGDGYSEYRVCRHDSYR